MCFSQVLHNTTDAQASFNLQYIIQMSSTTCMIIIKYIAKTQNTLARHNEATLATPLDTLLTMFSSWALEGIHIGQSLFKVFTHGQGA